MSAAHKNECPVAAGQVANKITDDKGHFTQMRRAWLAIISVAQRHAIDALLLASSVQLLLALAAVLGVLQ